MKRVFCILFLITYSTHLSAQSVVDSLRKKATNPTTEISDKVQALNQLASVFMRSFKKDSMIFYSNIAVEKARTTGDKELLLSALYYNAIAYDRVKPAVMKQILEELIVIADEIGDMSYLSRGIKMKSDLLTDEGDFIGAIGLLEQSIDILESIISEDSTGSYAIRIGQYRHNIASKYYSLQEFDKALEAAIENEEYAKEIGYQDLQLRIGQMIAAIYSSLAVNAELNNLQVEPERYYQLSIEYGKQFLSKAIELDHIRFIGYGYSTVGNSFMKLGQLDSARYYISKSIPIALQTEEYDSYANRLNLMGAIEFELKNYERAEEYLLDGLATAREIKDRVVEVQLLNNIAKAEMQLGKISDSRAYLLQAVELSLLLKRFGTAAESYGLMKELEQKSGNFEAALQAYENQVQYQDSIEKSKNLDRFEELQTKYETEKVEAENELLQKEAKVQALQIRNRNIQIILSIVFLILITGGVYFWYRNKLARQQKLMQEANQRLLTLQMNPHFLFNTLVTIQSFVIQNKDRLEVANFIADYARVTRMVLEFSRKTLVPLEKELELLKEFLNLQQIRTSQNFEYVFKVDAELDLADTYFPPMIAQPFIENAIEHGIIPSKLETGMINISIIKKGNRVLFQVDDNGVGLNQDEVGNKNHKSLSTQITEERFALLQKVTGKPFVYRVVNKETKSGEKGVRVEFEIPILDQAFKKRLSALLTV